MKFRIISTSAGFKAQYKNIFGFWSTIMERRHTPPNCVVSMFYDAPMSFKTIEAAEQYCTKTYKMPQATKDKIVKEFSV